MLSGLFSTPTRCCAAAMIVCAFTGSVSALEIESQQQLALRIEEAPQEHPLVPALKLADEALRKVAAVDDYEAVFVKKELVNGVFLEQKMQIRFRRQPMSVYLKFVEPHEGRQVLYVAGQNGGEMKVKETGLASLVGSVNVDPHGAMALSESKYPITMIGMEKMTRRLMSGWLDATTRDDISVKFYPNAKIGGLECRVIEAVHADAAKNAGIFKARLYIDKASGLPIRIQEYGVPTEAEGDPPLLADYGYFNVRTDVGLTASDFDARNPRYGF